MSRWYLLFDGGLDGLAKGNTTKDGEGYLFPEQRSIMRTDVWKNAKNLKSKLGNILTPNHILRVPCMKEIVDHSIRFLTDATDGFLHCRDLITDRSEKLRWLTSEKAGPASFL